MKLTCLKNCLIFLCFITSSLSYGQTTTTITHPAIQLPTVVIVTTGGTIAEETDPKTGAAIPTVTGKDLIKAIPGLSEIANIQVVNFSNIDSSRMSPDIWLRLSKVVNKTLRDPKVKGVVVTHGTDTMDVASYFLDLTVASNKPVVFTGAMRDASSPFADGPLNILNAVREAISPNAQNWGVTVTLNQYINSAHDVRKTQSTNPQTFDSGEKGYLGYIVDGKILRFRNILPRIVFQEPKQLPKVYLIEAYAGADGDLIQTAIDHQAKGIVVEGLGAGNVNQAMFEAIKAALKKHIVVIVATRVSNGGTYPAYGGPGGGATLQRYGAILCENALSGPKARIMLMLALATYGNQPSQLVKFFH
ncbi:MAG: asparaginase [Gammaproteobacteria bacterium]|nr:asparaginase [Gammaproteobacteria bacterium]